MTAARAAVVSLALSLGAAGPARADGPSGVVYPPQSIPLNFSHARHLRLDLPCTRCHPEALTSVRTSDLLVPPEATCLECHDGAPGNASALACGGCHEGFTGTQRGEGRPRALRMPSARLKFPHRRHAQAGVECEQCHVGMPFVGLATVDQLPREARCVGCHEERSAPTACATCHPTTAQGLVQTDFAGAPATLDPSVRAGLPRHGGRLVPAGARGAAHDDTWAEDHGPTATADPGLCRACHDEPSCRGCHAGVMRPVRAHPDDWVTLHPLAARSGALRCQACHTAQTFCRDCHRRTRVVSRSEDPAFALPAQTTLHPAGWTSPRGGSPDHHGTHARRDIAACAACHSERTCTRCHAAAGGGGLGVSPHPAGFGDRCAPLLARNPRPCETCHGAGWRCPP